MDPIIETSKQVAERDHNNFRRQESQTLYFPQRDLKQVGIFKEDFIKVADPQARRYMKDKHQDYQKRLFEFNMSSRPLGAAKTETGSFLRADHEKENSVDGSQASRADTAYQKVRERFENARSAISGVKDTDNPLSIIVNDVNAIRVWPPKREGKEGRSSRKSAPGQNNSPTYTILEQGTLRRRGGPQKVEDSEHRPSKRRKGYQKSAQHGSSGQQLKENPVDEDTARTVLKVVVQGQGIAYKAYMKDFSRQLDTIAKFPEMRVSTKFVNGRFQNDGKASSDPFAMIATWRDPGWKASRNAVGVNHLISETIKDVKAVRKWSPPEGKGDAYLAYETTKAKRMRYHTRIPDGIFTAKEMAHALVKTPPRPQTLAGGPRDRHGQLFGPSQMVQTLRELHRQGRKSDLKQSNTKHEHSKQGGLERRAEPPGDEKRGTSTRRKSTQAPALRGNLHQQLKEDPIDGNTARTVLKIIANQQSKVYKDNMKDYNHKLQHMGKSPRQTEMWYDVERNLFTSKVTEAHKTHMKKYAQTWNSLWIARKGLGVNHLISETVKGVKAVGKWQAPGKKAGEVKTAQRDPEPKRSQSRLEKRALLQNDNTQTALKDGTVSEQPHLHVQGKLEKRLEKNPVNASTGRLILKLVGRQQGKAYHSLMDEYDRQHRIMDRICVTYYPLIGWQPWTENKHSNSKMNANHIAHTKACFQANKSFQAAQRALKTNHLLSGTIKDVKAVEMWQPQRKGGGSTKSKQENPHSKLERRAGPQKGDEPSASKRRKMDQQVEQLQRLPLRGRLQQQLRKQPVDADTSRLVLKLIGDQQGKLYNSQMDEWQRQNHIMKANGNKEGHWMRLWMTSEDFNLDADANFAAYEKASERAAKSWGVAQKAVRTNHRVSRTVKGVRNVKNWESHKDMKKRMLQQNDPTSSRSGYDILGLLRSPEWMEGSDTDLVWSQAAHSKTARKDSLDHQVSQQSRLETR
ncbi:hypothetical protein MMC10_004440 [Thelotrema lepadinum]|nr:hypothetical protein [Thelotrema lepadinum]